MEHLNSNVEHQLNQVQWRRDKVQELYKGYSQREISQVLQVGLATVNRDISYLKNQAKTNIKLYIDERLPEEYEKCLVGLTAITKEAWNAAHDPEYKSLNIVINNQAYFIDTIQSTSSPFEISHSQHLLPLALLDF